MASLALLSEPMRKVLTACSARGGRVYMRELLKPGAPNVERASLGRTVRRLWRRKFVRLAQRRRRPDEPQRRRNYVWFIDLTDAGRAVVHSLAETAE
jgi:hypothetical protein